MPTPRKSVTQLAELIQNPARALTDPQYWQESTCYRWLHHVGVVHLSDPAAAVPLAILGVRLALRISRRQSKRRPRDPCVLARAYGVLALAHPHTCHRSTLALAKAESIAAKCKDPDVWSDVCCRRAAHCINGAQGSDGSHAPAEVQAALQLAEMAVEKARSTYALARAKTIRGLIRIRAGKPREGARDARAALEALDHKLHPCEHVSALSVFISALVRDRSEAREEAAAYLKQLRQLIPGHYPATRARLLWTEALLYIPNRRSKARPRQLLDKARRTFVRLGMEAEAVALTTELTRLAPEGAVPRICTELLAILTPGPIRDLVEKLRSVRAFERVGIAEKLRAMIRGPGVLPEAAFPRP